MPALLIVLVLALVPAAAASAAPADPPREAPRAKAAKRPLLRTYVDLSPRFRGPRIPRSFLGFSLEYTQIPRYLGAPAPNTPLVELLRGLGEGGLGPPVIRMGGGTTENTWVPMGPHNPPGIYQRLSTQELDLLAGELRAADALAIMGINTTYPRSPIHAVQAQAMAEHLGRDRIMAFELGNEPGLYTDRYWYTDKSGKDHNVRPRGWGIRDYLSEIRSVSRDLREVTPSIPVSGPATDYRIRWIKAIPRFARAAGRDMGMVTIHDYPLTACEEGDGPDRLGKILEEGPRIGAAIRTEKVVELVRRKRLGVPVRLTETNSASCGGLPGASDRFASALWGIEHLLSMAAVGASGINFHASSPGYQPFTVRRGENWAPVVTVRPLFYAMRVFADATRNRPRLIPTTYFDDRRRWGTIVRTWGLHDDKEDEVRLITVYKRGPRSGTVQVKVPRGAESATLQRLEARTVQSRDGITWGGRSYATPTDGQLQGDLVTETVRRRGAKRYRYRMTPGSAAMLTVKLR